MVTGGAPETDPALIHDRDSKFSRAFVDVLGRRRRACDQPSVERPRRRSRSRSRSPNAAVLQAKTRRDAFDDAIIALAAEPPFAEIVGRLVCLRGIATLTALALTVEIGDWQRFRPQSLGAFLGLTRVRTRRVSVAGSARSPRPATLTPAGCSSRRPGSSDDRCARARRSSDDGWDSRPPYAPALTRAQDGSTSAGTHSSDVANGVRSSRSRSRASSPDTAGHSRPCSQNQRRLRRGERSDERREERPAAQL